MERCLDWLEGLGPDLALAAHPLLMDGSWLDWYLRRLCNAAIFSGPFRIRCPFVGAGVDVPSYVQAALKMEYFTARPDYPPELLRDVPHTHKPIDDARGHAALYFSAPATREDARDVVGPVPLPNRPGAGQFDFPAPKLRILLARHIRLVLAQIPVPRVRRLPPELVNVRTARAPAA